MHKLYLSRKYIHILAMLHLRPTFTQALRVNKAVQTPDFSKEYSIRSTILVIISHYVRHLTSDKNGLLGHIL